MSKESTINNLAMLATTTMPTTARDAVLARILQSQQIPLPSDLLDEGKPPRPRGAVLLASACAVVVAAGIAGAALELSGGGAPTGKVAAPHTSTPQQGVAPAHPSGASVRARLLAALNASSSDVVQTRSQIGDGRIVERWANAGNTKSVTIDIGSDGQPTEESSVSFNSSGTTFVTLYPASKTWTTSFQPIVTGGSVPIAPPSILGQIEHGIETVVATNVSVDGHNTIEVAGADPDGVTNDLWVDSTTYLPVQATESTGGKSVPVSQTSWTYYPPTAAALAKVQLSIPSGYEQADTPPATPGTGS